MSKQKELVIEADVLVKAYYYLPVPEDVNEDDAESMDDYVTNHLKTLEKSRKILRAAEEEEAQEITDYTWEIK